jgi:hypothetical protein
MRSHYRSRLMRFSRTPTASLLGMALGMALAALLLYLPFRSASLDDFDSYNFARALARFDPAAFQPHPPGYVLYVLLGRVALAFTGDARVALTTLSAVCAALSVGLLFMLGSLLFNRRVGLLAGLLTLAAPLMWLNAGKALSDAPGLCAAALGGLALALSARRRLPLWVAAGWLGVAAGFRPQGVIGLLAAWALVALWQRVGWRAWLSGIVAAAVGALTWLLPLLAALGWNVGALAGYLGGAAGFVAGQESLFAVALTPQTLGERAQAVWVWASRAVFGPWPEAARVALGLGTCTLIGVALLAWRQRGKQRIGLALCVAWALPQIALQLLLLNPELTRYLLALLFPVALLAALGIERVCVRQTRAGVGVALVFCALTGATALPLAHGLHVVPAPPDQLAAALSQQLPRDQTLIMARQSYNALAYLLPDWRVRFADAYAPDALPGLIADSRAIFVVLADPEGIQPGEAYVQVQTLQFARDAQIHAKHAAVTADVYALSTALRPADYVLPADGVIRMGTPQDGKYLISGWYRREDVGSLPARWTGSAESAALRVLLPSGAHMLTLRALSFAPAQTLTVRCNDQVVGRLSVPQEWTTLRFDLPPACVSAHTPARLELRTSQRRAPADAGTSTDRRTLGVAVAEVQVY